MGASVTGNKKSSLLVNASQGCRLEEILLRSRTPVMLLSLREIRCVGNLHIKPNKEESQTRAFVNTEINMQNLSSTFTQPFYLQINDSDMFRPSVLAIFGKLVNFFACAAYFLTYIAGTLHILKIISMMIKCYISYNRYRV